MVKYVDRQIMTSSLIFTLLTFSILISTVASVCSCCPKLSIALNCSTNSTNVKLINNGYRCVAKTGSDVTLNCVVPDLVPDVVNKVEYVFWKAEEVVQATIFSKFSQKHKLNNTECNRADNSSSSCKLSAVTWKSETVHLTDHDSLVYQCQAIVTIAENIQPVVIYSNSLWVDVMYNIDTTTVAAGTTSLRDIRSEEPATKLACEIPATNPPSKAIWSKHSGSAWVEIDFTNQPRQFVVEKVIHSTSSLASLLFVEGTLVIALFKEVDKGSYRCNITYNDEFNTKTSYDKVSNSTLTYNSFVSNDAGAAALVSQITQHEHITENGSSSFTCHGRDIDASAADSAPYRYSWSYKNKSTVVPINNTTKVWEGINFTNYNRTMNFTADHTMIDKNIEFYCTVTKTVSGTLKTVTSTKFKPPAILPEKYLIPSTSSQCNDNITVQMLFEPNKVLFSNPDSNYDSSVAKQNLSGSSAAWLEAGVQLSTFETPYKSVNGYELKVDLSLEAETKTYYKNKCRYLQLFRVYDKLYQMQEVFGIVRPNAPIGLAEDKCGGSLIESDVVMACDEQGNINAKVTKANVGCLRASVQHKITEDIVMERTLGCATTDRVYTICNLNTDCKALAKPNNIGDYRVVLVVDGDSKGGLTIDLEGCNANPVNPTCPNSTVSNITEFIEITCGSAMVKRGCWNVNYSETGKTSDITEPSNPCLNNASVGIPDDFKSSFLDFTFKCYETIGGAEEWNLTMKNVSMKHEEPDDDNTVVIIVILVATGTAITVILVICYICRDTINRILGWKSTQNDEGKYCEDGSKGGSTGLQNSALPVFSLLILLIIAK